jgi:hypothetical protein
MSEGLGLKNILIILIILLITIFSGCISDKTKGQVKTSNRPTESPGATQSPGLTEAPTSDSGIEGVVFIGPTGKVLPNQPQQNVPYVATIIVQDENRETDLKTIESREDGTFRISIPPGNYWLIPVLPNPGAPPFAGPLEVRVEPHGFSPVEIHYDTGIR